MPSDSLIESNAGVDESPTPKGPYLPSAGPSPVQSGGATPLAAGQRAPGASPRPALAGWANGLPNSLGGNQRVSSVSRYKKKRSAAGFFKLVGLLLIVSIGSRLALLVVANLVFEEKSLPTFSALPPAYGTVTSVVEIQAPDAQKFTVITDPAGTSIHLSWWADSATSPGAEALISESARFDKDTPASEWRLTSDRGSDYYADLLDLTTVRVWSDYVPEVVRSYTTIRTSGHEDLNGHSTERYELAIEQGRFSREKPADYGAWIGSDDSLMFIGDSVIRMVLWVDEAGVVWRYESWSDGRRDKVVVALASFTPEPFAPVLPARYIDEVNGGVLVGG